MKLSSLEISNFKNIESDSLVLDGLNLFSGPNGSGKTNRLEAIYYLCLTRGFSGLQDAQLVTSGHSFFYLEGHFELENSPKNVISAGWQAGKKLFRQQGQPINRLADHIGQFPVVMIAPTDTLLITEGSETRRRFFDGWLSQCHQDYLETLLAYNKLIQQRNALLKQGQSLQRWDDDLIEIIDLQRAPLEALIRSYRNRLLNQALPAFQIHYQTMAGAHELPGFGIVELPLRPLQEEKNAGLTLSGPHRDKVDFSLNRQSLRKFASQGQQKSFLIALKLAQHDYFWEVKARKPLLLLDDIFEKLDQQRLKYLMELVTRDQFGQIFITDTDYKRVFALFEPIGKEINHLPVGSK